MQLLVNYSHNSKEVLTFSKITPASAICLFFILSAFAYDLYYFTLSDCGFFFFFSFFLSVFHSLINSTFRNSKGLSCLYNKQKLIIHGSDMPQAVISGNLSLYADDTTVHCIGSTVDKACNQLNNALDELNKWCMTNSLTNGA